LLPLKAFSIGHHMEQWFPLILLAVFFFHSLFLLLVVEANPEIY
jgi:CHASE1-domain containing sensor protein